MSIFTISDLHLSFGSDKPMNIFRGWEDHTEKLEKNCTQTELVNNIQEGLRKSLHGQYMELNIVQILKKMLTNCKNTSIILVAIKK